MTSRQGWLKDGRSEPAPVPDIDSEEVARVAYALYEQRGRTEGQALVDWVNAEAIVRERQQQRSRPRARNGWGVTRRRRAP